MLTLKKLLVVNLITTISAMPPQDSQVDCPTFCPFILKEVCGTDGNSYDNECLLTAESCLSGKHIAVLKNGPCHPSGSRSSQESSSISSSDELIEAAAAGCDLGCERIYHPVCGSDGQMYDNECILKELACINQTPKLVSKPMEFCSSHESVNRDDVKSCTAIRCTRIAKPICASDGRTYQNECMMSLQSCNEGLQLEVIYRGPCGSPLTPVEDDGHVTIVQDPDRNATILVQKREAQQITPGRLRESHQFGRRCPEFCPLNFAPVCGSDGVTYSNECALGVAACKSTSRILIIKVRDGPCAQKVCPVACTAEFDPVCGTDGVTYSNECHLEVAACRGGGLTLAWFGPC